MKEKTGISISGWFLLLLLIGGGIALSQTLPIEEWLSGEGENLELLFYLPIPAFFILIFLLRGFYTIEPNESMIQLFLGTYIGTDKKTGFRWTIPFFSRTRASLRIQDFETELIKVNDLNGNPVELSAIVIWKVENTAAAYFNVEDFAQFIKKQSIAALRGLAMTYPYESFDSKTHALITHTEEVAENLKIQIQEKVAVAGLEILEARINHLSYAKEIASAMLQRQQASAIISAKTEIVEGAVGMVQMALSKLEKEDVVMLNETDKAKLVSNLLVVLCSDQGTQPIISTET